jgi:hypothetical protein
METNKKISTAGRKKIAADIKARFQYEFDKGTARRNMATFKRMLKETICWQGNANNAWDWIGPLCDATPISSPFWEPVNTAYAAVASVMSGSTKHLSPEVKRLARTFRKQFDSTFTTA